MTGKINRLTLSIFLALVPGIPGILHAFDTAERPYESAGTATTVSISTSAWTKVPASASVLKNRAGIYVNVPATNTAAVAGVLVQSDVTPPAITVRPIEMAKGTNRFFEAGPNMNLYLLSLHTAAESVHVEELAK